MSGFWLGPNRIRRQRGDSEFCPHCQAIEDVTHVLFSCPKAKQVWESLLAWWGKRTHDHLDCSIRVTLLGLRYSPDDDQDRLRFEELATPFAFLRTHAYDILLRERRRRHGGLPARPVFNLVSAILKICSAAPTRSSWPPAHGTDGIPLWRTPTPAPLGLLNLSGSAPVWRSLRLRLPYLWS